MVIMANMFTAGYLTFMPILMQFNEDLNKYTGLPEETLFMISIDFADDVKAEGEETLAYCNTGTGFIGVDELEWSKLSRIEKQILVYHEVGHCALGLDHTATKTDIMAPVLMDERRFRMYKESILKRFFKQYQDSLK